MIFHLRDTCINREGSVGGSAAFHYWKKLRNLGGVRLSAEKVRGAQTWIIPGIFPDLTLFVFSGRRWMSW